ncbi:unnamed protein product [marine sediment metagenome]|uniref:Uncharacterized protein n=1 Tax=marine sediment metagenome TaxID=412755 RepID=X0TQW1_9ZZZZ
MKKLNRIVEYSKSRVSGTGSFPVPQKKDIGRNVIIKRMCITWDGCLGYFANDKKAKTYAFYLAELE